MLKKSQDDFFSQIMDADGNNDVSLDELEALPGINKSLAVEIHGMLEQHG